MRLRTRQEPSFWPAIQQSSFQIGATLLLALAATAYGHARLGEVRALTALPEKSAQASGGVFCAMPAFRVGGQPTEREDPSITRGDDVRVEPWPPQLDERRVLPG